MSYVKSQHDRYQLTLSYLGRGGGLVQEDVSVIFPCSMLEVAVDEDTLLSFRFSLNWSRLLNGFKILESFTTMMRSFSKQIQLITRLSRDGKSVVTLIKVLYKSRCWVNFNHHHSSPRRKKKINNSTCKVVKVILQHNQLVGTGHQFHMVGTFAIKEHERTRKSTRENKRNFTEFSNSI